jgi:putative membrane-bound dehydrogenase-like protein
MSWCRLLIFCVVFTLPSVAVAQVPPERCEATFTVADGLEMKLWASEPLFANPTCMDIDHLGRVWVCESVNYRTKLHRKPLNRAEGDRIVILQDTTGSGKADKAVTFYQSPELYGPMGIAVAKDPVGPGYKVFVCQSPDILVFTDSKGVGKADGPPTKLLSGFGGFDHDHGVHGILIGPDLKLYFSVGDQGVRNLQSSDGKGRKWTSNNTDCQAGTIWRCDLDGKNLELIAHNFRNEYEPCVDSFGTVFVSDNDDDGNQQTRICYVMPGGNYGYHAPRKVSHWNEELPGVVPKILRTGFGSPTGLCVYEGTLLPKKYWGQLLHTDAGPRHVRCYHLKANGAGYDVDREDMVTSTDNWFRPSDVCVAPDGSVFVADWYDPGVGGHGMGDTTRGRIFRLAPKRNKPSVPKVDLESDEGILAALGSPNLAVRYMAMAHIAEMKLEDTIHLLDETIKWKEQPVLRARALWQLARAYAKANQLNSRVLSPLIDDDPRLQCLGFRLLNDFWGAAEWYATDGLVLDVKIIMQVRKDKVDPAALRECLVTLRNAKPVKAKDSIYSLMKRYDGKDRFYLEAIGIAVGHYDKERRDIILKDFDKEFPQWNDKVADLVWELQPPVMMPKLGHYLADKTLPAVQRARIVDILALSDDKDAGKAMLNVLQSDVQPEVRDKVLDNLKLFLPGKWRELRGSSELDTLLKTLMGKRETQAIGLVLIGAAEKGEWLKEVGEYARNVNEALPVRKTAIATLGMLPSNDTPKTLETLLNIEPVSLRLDVLQALAKLAGQTNARALGAGGALKVLQTVVGDKNNAPALRVEGVSALAGTRQGTEWLLALHDKDGLDDAIKPEVGRYLRNSPYQDLRNKALLAFPPPGKLDPKKLPAIAVLAKRKGDAAKGKLLFAASVKSNLQCMKCHTVRGQGGQIGPDLSMIGKKASRENLLESILYPSKAIADQYVSWIIETKKGQAVTGLIVEETKDAVVLRDANGKDTKIEANQIDSRSKSLKSLMPEDLLRYMSEDELLDVVEYLFTLKTPALALEAWHIAGPFDNGDNDAGLDKAYPPEKGVDLKAVYDGKLGKVAWQTVKPDGQGYVDLQAFFAPNSDNIVSYLYREIESPVDQDATILLGSDDGCKLWLNGKLVHTDRSHRAAVPEQDHVRVKLTKGKNVILLKINNGNGAHGFYFTILAEQELKRLAEK